MKPNHPIWLKFGVVVENNNDTPLEKNSKNITNACNNKNSMNKESAKFDTPNDGTDNLKGT